MFVVPAPVTFGGTLDTDHDYDYYHLCYEDYLTRSEYEDVPAGSENNEDALAGGGSNDDALAGGKDNDDALARDKDEDTLARDEERVIDVPTCHEECAIDSSRSKMMSTTSSPSMDVISKILTAMKSVAPNLVYCVRKAKKIRRKKVMKRICPELMDIWDNAATIVTPAATNSRQSHTCTFPRVDWQSVNKRFLTNIPSPVPLPMFGCSADPADYENVYGRNDFGNMVNQGSKFSRDLH